METLPEYHKIIFDDLRKERDQLKAINGELVEALELVHHYFTGGVMSNRHIADMKNKINLLVNKGKPF